MADKPFQVSLDPDLEDLIPAYLERRREDVRNLHAALGTSDLKTILVIGHRLRGNAATFGFSLLEEIGAQLEDTAKAGSTDGLAEAVARMENFLANLEINYV